ncbi:hypothetical protein RJ639_004716 [Escallonia herrerae]|uniref:Uncharacterized protein n=1 Tax=Escallonia herrerae TaxID=1293975 RepID=A0AA88W1W3_9ASTE|nr:hypothetical protein RJ639_004716 [Escallonia herrerae]
MENVLTFLNTPSVGTSPSSSLYEREHDSGKKAQQVARVSYQSADCTEGPMLVVLCNSPVIKLQLFVELNRVIL